MRALLRVRFEALLRENTSPTGLGVAIGVGVLCGCSPLLGFQFLTALLLAWIFRLNKIAVMIGLQISIPPFTPVIVLAGIELGELMLRGRMLTLSIEQIRATPARELMKMFFIDLTVGGLTLGTVLGAALGAATAAWARRRQRRPAS